MITAESPVIHEESLTLDGTAAGERPIRITIRLLMDHLPKPVIVICHSFMAFKDWGFFPVLARSMAASGYVTISFNFSWNGVVGDGNRITDFDTFSRNTFTRELADLHRIVDAVAGGSLSPLVPPGSPVALFGHSRGGGIAILHSSLDERINALVTWAAISHFDRWTDHQKSLWRLHGSLPLARNATVSPLRLGDEILHDLESYHERFDLVSAAARIRIPWLIVHGQADVTVPPREGELLFKSADRNRTELVLLEGTGHLFNAASEEDDGYKVLDKSLSLTTGWLHSQLYKERR